MGDEFHTGLLPPLVAGARPYVVAMEAEGASGASGLRSCEHQYAYRVRGNTSTDPTFPSTAAL